MKDRLLHPLRRIIEEAPCTLLLVPFCVGIVLSEWGWVAWLGRWALIGAVASLMGIAAIAHIAARRTAHFRSVFYIVVFALCSAVGIVCDRAHCAAPATWPDELAVWQGVVVEEPRQTAKTWRLTIRLDSAHHCRKVMLTALKESTPTPPSVGSAVLINSRIEQPHNFATDSATLRSSFDYATWLRRQGYTGQAFSWQPLDTLPTTRAQQLLSQQPLFTQLQTRALQWRHALTQQYQHLDLSADEYSTLAALTLGSKAQLTAYTRHMFSTAGASHVLALSGLHLSILVALLLALMRPMTYRRSTRLALTAIMLVLTWAFVLLTGCSISIVRAATMLSIMLIASLRGEGVASLNNLLLAALAILLFTPQSIMDIGFQLSFVAVFCLLYFNPYYQLLRPRFKRRPLHAVCDFLFVTITAQLATAPIVATTFGQLPVWFLLTNVIVIPCAYILLCGALLFFALNWWAPVAALVGWVLQSVTHGMLASLQWIAALPMASVSLSPNALSACLCYPALFALFAWLILRRHHYMYAAILCAALIASVEIWLG